MAKVLKKDPNENMDSVAEKALISLQLTIPCLQLRRTSITS